MSMLVLSANTTPALLRPPKTQLALRCSQTRLYGAGGRGEAARTCVHLFINKSEQLSSPSSSPKNGVKNQWAFFYNKIFPQKAASVKVYFTRLFFSFKVIKVPAKLFIKIFLSSGGQNVLLIFALKIWGTVLKKRWEGLKKQCLL